MAKQTDLYLPRLIKNAATTIVNGDGTALKTLYTATADDAIIKSLNATISIATAHNLNIWLTINAVDYLLGTVPVPASSGFLGTVVAVDLLSATWLSSLPLDRNGKRILPLATGIILKVSSVATLASGTMTVQAMIEEY